ncbi:EAL domain-containing protein [Sphingomonas sp. CARO-RG-8B-R24-01]|uniref:EAL domain-containing protein n=1 Tax=Sphingomonas sp. CARO-RG-8B-R24-01 TaxID=2914831 RepID=UPI001F5A1C11|nr:EAL domain-containing protein [Sphingomonas sp. CARO-RG-8B-R24-01]
MPSPDHAVIPSAESGGVRNTRTAEGRATMAVAADGRWHCVCIVEIVNFLAMRRLLGRVRADRLRDDVRTRLAQHCADLETTVAGREALEFWLDRESYADVLLTIAELDAMFVAPFDLDNESHRLEIVIGAATAPLHTTEDVRLVEEAEFALDEARREQHSVLRDLSAGTAAFDRLTLTRELPSAIAKGEMFLQYQPKVHVRKMAINSAEALVRWQHPERGLILPGDFITVAEEANQIAPLTLWTLDRVISDQKILVADGRDLTLFINISGKLLGDAAFVAEACAKIQGSGAKIGFEITETAVIRDPECAIANLQTLAGVGISIAIDDYGAGLSSLAYLKQLPARELKIDKLFVSQLTSSNRDPLIVRSTIDLAHALDMEVTAEGVETRAAMALLTVMGCDMIQGYLISRPISIDALRVFLQDEVGSPGDQVREAMFSRPASLWKSA